MLLASQNPYPIIVYFWPILWPIIDPTFVTFWQIIFLILRKCLKRRTHYSQSSCEKCDQDQRHIPSSPLLGSAPPPQPHQPGTPFNLPSRNKPIHLPLLPLSSNLPRYQLLSKKSYRSKFVECVGVGWIMEGYLLSCVSSPYPRI